jgi:alkylation response protein AidB-like acyl-CoA dehydrogenase
MITGLAEQQVQLQKWAHGFAERVLRPAAEEWDEREEVPWPIISEAARAGIHSSEFVDDAIDDPTGMNWPLVGEEMAWGDPGLCIAIMSTGMATRALRTNATAEQCAEWIPECFGTPEQPRLLGVGISEPDAGSDVGAMRTSAVYDEAHDEWVLNGTKAWVTNGGVAHIHVIIASVAPELGARGHAAFVVPHGARGLTQGQKYRKLGIRASHTAEVVLQDCRVPGRCLLGGKEVLEDRLASARQGRSTGRHAGLATL